MKLSHIEFNNFKAFRNERLSFEDKLTVIAGANGAGKSSVLDTINICLSWIVARLRSEEGRGNYIKESQITVGQTSAKLTAFFDGFGEIDIPNKSVKGVDKLATLDISSLKEYSERKRKEIAQTNFKTSIPVFAHYDVRRAVVDVPFRVSETAFEMFDTYKDSLKGAANFRNFFQWFRAEEDIENEALREQISIPANSVLNSFRTALSRFLPDYNNIRVKRRPLRMEIDKEGITLNISQLSDGEKIYIALIGDLCKRLSLANPTLQDPTQGEGIILIDEIDLHLHPNWQREIATKLPAVFPNIQFIITTHSPHVINSVPTESVRLLHNEGGIISISNAEYGYGLPSKIVLKDIMGLTDDLPNEVSTLVNEIYSMLTSADIIHLREKVDELSRISPRHPELTYFRRYIERRERQ